MARPRPTAPAITAPALRGVPRAGAGVHPRGREEADRAQPKSSTRLPNDRVTNLSVDSNNDPDLDACENRSRDRCAVDRSKGPAHTEW